MEVIKITEERMEQVLTDNIKRSDVISKNAKMVLATIMNYHYVLDVCKNSRYLIIPTETLRESVGIGKEQLLTATQELIEFDLIEKETGKRWKKGERPKASKYIVKWNNLKNELKKKTSDDLISTFLDSPEIGGSPIVSVNVSDSVSDNVIDSVSDSVSVYDSENVSDFKENNILLKKDYIKEEKDYIEYNEILDRIYQKEEENLKKEEKPSEPRNYKELQDLFIEKLKNSCEDEKTYSELEEIGEALHAELETNFNHIPSYELIHFTIQRTIETKQSKVLPVTIIDYQNF